MRRFIASRNGMSRSSPQEREASSQQWARAVASGLNGKLQLPALQSNGTQHQGNVEGEVVSVEFQKPNLPTAAYHGQNRTLEHFELVDQTGEPGVITRVQQMPPDRKRTWLQASLAPTKCKIRLYGPVVDEKPR